MTHGALPVEPRLALVTVRPGPVLHVWRNGAEFCAVPLTAQAALSICRDLLAAVQVRGVQS